MATEKLVFEIETADVARIAKVCGTLIDRLTRDDEPTGTKVEFDEAGIETDLHFVKRFTKTGWIDAVCSDEKREAQKTVVRDDDMVTIVGVSP